MSNITVYAEGESRLARAWYRAAVRTMIVAGVFCLAVSALLIANWYRNRVSGWYQVQISQADNPPPPDAITALKQRLAKRAEDETLKDELRGVDLELREDYFERRAFSLDGAYILAGGMVVFLLALKYAADFGRKLPMPQALPEGNQHPFRAAAIARWSVAGLGVMLCGTALALAVNVTSDLAPPGTQEVGTVPSAAAPVLGSVPVRFPTEEEIAKNWPRFRGPRGLGVSAYANVPASFDGKTGANIRWKTPVPMPGNSSPVVWGDRVFLSGADEKKREVYAFDAKSGKLLWRGSVPGDPKLNLPPPKISKDTGYAAPTMVVDGQRAFAMFANADVACFDFSGKKVWERSLGVPKNSYGHATSLAMYQKLLLVVFDQSTGKDNKSQLLALDALTGKTVWQTPRKVPNSWSSPIVVQAAGREQLITCADPWVISYDPANGTELWRAKGLGGDVAPSPAFADGMVYAAQDYSKLLAVRTDGKGDVTASHIAWSGEDGLPDICSLLTDGKIVLLVTSNGTLTCYNAKDGSQAWTHDFDDELFQASPSLVGDKIYLLSEKGTMYILQTGKEYKELGKSDLGEEALTSPAFQDGCFYIRGKTHLICVGGK
ncbi:MAG: PQQ-binding-like beta-propeller repeat protein [Pirellulales bacterium]